MHVVRARALAQTWDLESRFGILASIRCCVCGGAFYAGASAQQCRRLLLAAAAWLSLSERAPASSSSSSRVPHSFLQALRLAGSAHTISIAAHMRARTHAHTRHRYVRSAWTYYHFAYYPHMRAGHDLRGVRARAVATTTNRSANTLPQRQHTARTHAHGYVMCSTNGIITHACSACSCECVCVVYLGRMNAMRVQISIEPPQAVYTHIFCSTHASPPYAREPDSGHRSPHYTHTAQTYARVTARRAHRVSVRSTSHPVAAAKPAHSIIKTINADHL